MGSSPTRPTCGLGALSRWSVDRFVDRCHRYEVTVAELLDEYVPVACCCVAGLNGYQA